MGSGNMILAFIGAVVVIAVVIWLIVACCAGPGGGGCCQPGWNGGVGACCRICQQSPCICNTNVAIIGRSCCSTCGCNPCRCSSSLASFGLGFRIGGRPLVAGAASLITTADASVVTAVTLPTIGLTVNVATTAIVGNNIAFGTFGRGKSKFVFPIKETDGTYTSIQVRQSSKSCGCGGNSSSCCNCNGSPTTYQVSADLSVLRTGNTDDLPIFASGVLQIQPTTLVGQLLFTPTNSGIAQVVAALTVSNPIPVPTAVSTWDDYMFVQHALLTPITFTSRQRGVFSVRLAVIADSGDPTLIAQIIGESVFTVDTCANQFIQPACCCKCFRATCNGGCGAGACGWCGSASCGGCGGNGCSRCRRNPCCCNAVTNVTICVYCQQPGCNGSCRGGAGW